MLEITKKLERHVYQPNETIIRRDERVDYFFMIENGEVDVVLQGRSREDTVLARLGTGGGVDGFLSFRSAMQSTTVSRLKKL